MPRKEKPEAAPRVERPRARRSVTTSPSLPATPPTPALTVPKIAVAEAPLAKRVGARRTGTSLEPAVAGTVASPKVEVAAARPRKTKRPSAAAQKVVPVVSAPIAGAVEPRESHLSVQDQLHEIEQRIDALLDDVHDAGGDVQARKRASEAIGHMAARLDADQPLEPLDSAQLLSTAREMLSTDYYLRQWGRIGMRNRSEQVDDFGLDPTYEARVRPLFQMLYERYFRVETEGLEHIPNQGRVLLIGNHSGTIPFDGVMLKTAIGMHHAAHREMRWLAEDFVFHFPFLGAFMNRIGAVRACQENAQRLLAQESLLAVFPEGIQGIGKLYRDRYRLQRFGRGGYIKLALRTGTPIVPVAIVGAEETYPLLLKLTKLAKPLGVPFVPVTPLFPWLGPVGLLPLPSRWRIRVGAPITELSEYGPSDAEDPIVVNRLNERVRQAIQEMLGAALQERGEHAFVAAS